MCLDNYEIMPCFYPITAYKKRSKNPSGKRGITFNPKLGYSDLKLEIPCNQCIGCKLDYSFQWSVRLQHENQMHSESMFITLTYNDENLPIDESLNLKHTQNFIRALRQKIHPQKIRFYIAGEYGEESRRPHYHAIIFGYRFGDLELWKHDDTPLYTSETLSNIWNKGFCSIGEVNQTTAQYVAKYVTKKINFIEGKSPEKLRDYYQHITRFGESVTLKKEYATMSLKPAIGATWFEKYQGDAYPSDFTINAAGKKQKNPKFYDTLMNRKNEKKLKQIKRRRTNKAKKHKEDQTFERLIVREKCAQARIQQRKL